MTDRLMAGRFYDVMGNPISDEVGQALMADFECRRIGHDTVVTDAGPVEVSTIFIPDDMRTQEDIEAGLPPLLFETAALLGNEDIIQERCSTGYDAVRAHLDVLGRVKAGRL
jgi:hypothetical protein